MLHTCVERFNVMGGRGNILGWDGEVNKALILLRVIYNCNYFYCYCCRSIRRCNRWDNGVQILGVSSIGIPIFDGDNNIAVVRHSRCNHCGSRCLLTYINHAYSFFALCRNKSTMRKLRQALIIFNFYSVDNVHEMNNYNLVHSFRSKNILSVRPRFGPSHRILLMIS
jgi:hypothetical protein